MSGELDYPGEDEWPHTECPECGGDGECRGAYDVVVGECGDCDGTGRVNDYNDKSAVVSPSALHTKTPKGPSRDWPEVSEGGGVDHLPPADAPPPALWLIRRARDSQFMATYLDEETARARLAYYSRSERGLTLVRYEISVGVREGGAVTVELADLDTGHTTPTPRALRWCTECGEQGVPIGKNPTCTLCGEEQIEPFRSGWDESD